jgi:hypothetical protein
LFLTPISASIRTTCRRGVGVHRAVDHVDPPTAVGDAVAQQPLGDRISVGLVEDQDSAQLVSRRR